MEKKSSQPDKFYADLSLTNTNDQPMEARVTDIRNQVILDHPEEYEMSIVRFECSMELIPIFIPETPNPAFPLRTGYSVTLLYGGVYYQEYINIDQTEKDYGIFNYGIWVEHYNIAAAAAYARLPGGITATKPPYFSYNPTTEKINLYVQLDYLESNVNRIQIGLDQLSIIKLNLPIKNYIGFGLANGFDGSIAVENYSSLVPAYGFRSGYPYFLSDASQAAAGDYLQIVEEYVSIANWSFVKEIVFTSGRIPVVQSFLPSSSGSGQSGTVSGQFLPVLTDFALLKSTSNFPIRGTAVYLPTAEYRRLSMNSNSNFDTLDFQAYFQDYNLRLYPIRLFKGTNVSMKILFERKKDTSTSIIKMLKELIFSQNK